ELANGFGNLASRVIAMVNRYFDGEIPVAVTYADADLQVQQVAARAINGAEKAIDEVAIHEAISSVWLLVDELNNYITVQEPWVLAKSDENVERLATVLYTAAEGLRVLAVALSPVVPKATQKLWAALAEDSLGALSQQSLSNAAVWGQLVAGSKVGELEALFPRIETEEK
ncbi:MAG: class I tRNA ligase family protein, partial [Micrococcales bacterium]